MKLYYIQGSPFARMTRVLIRETGLECEEAEIANFPPPERFFCINPLGQVPVLETEAGAVFPTRVILEFLVARAPIKVWMSREKHRWEDTQLLTVLLALCDIIVAQKYQLWSGLEESQQNVLGFNLDRRNSRRITSTLDWLENRSEAAGFLPSLLSVQDVVFACIILWTESRGRIPWRGRPQLEAIVASMEQRASFRETTPAPWRPNPTASVSR